MNAATDCLSPGTLRDGSVMGRAFSPPRQGRFIPGRGPGLVWEGPLAHGFTGRAFANRSSRAGVSSRGPKARRDFQPGASPWGNKGPKKQREVPKARTIFSWRQIPCLRDLVELVEDLAGLAAAAKAWRSRSRAAVASKGSVVIHTLHQSQPIVQTINRCLRHILFIYSCVSPGGAQGRTVSALGGSMLMILSWILRISFDFLKKSSTSVADASFESTMCWIWAR